MHTLNRLAVIAVLLVALVPLSSLALMDMSQRQEAKEALDRAIGGAAGAYRTRPRSQVPVQMNGIRIADPKIAREKRSIRLRISEYLSADKELKDRFGIVMAPIKDSGGPGSKKIYPALVVFDGNGSREKHRQKSAAEELVYTADVLAGADAGERSSKKLQSDLRSLIAKSGEGVRNIDGLRKRHEELLEMSSSSGKSPDPLPDSGSVSAERAEEIRRVFEDVHAEVLRMQSDLARIDAKLKSRAERKLIEKGLMSPKTGGDSNGIVSFTPSFIRPVYGRKTAGFMDGDYEKYFGIPHKGLDIAVPQGSPVAAAADGIVFLARDGGDRGYSYVLIGHRGGYATLYGHLSGFSVKAGDEVSAGTIIGTSGGAVGTRGAGPTTTGAHLHFEIVAGGVNQDPLPVLELAY